MKDSVPSKESMMEAITRVNALVPNSVTPRTRIEIHPSDWIKVTDEVERLGAELEIERMRLAACGTAALGYLKGCSPEYDSASLQDVLRLYAKAFPAETPGDDHG